MYGRYGIVDLGAAASTLALLTAVVMFSGPFAFETVLLTMAIWPAFADSMRQHKVPAVILSISLGAISLSEWGHIIRDWSVFGTLGVPTRFASGQLDAFQNIAYAAQFGIVACTPSLKFSYNEERQKKGAAEQILCAAALIFPLSAAVKWSHFVHLLPISDQTNRWGIRIFGPPNNEMTTLLLMGCTVAGGLALGGAASVFRNRAES
ncbi:hypothetical protein ACWIGM_03220 [Bosea sp. NPDC055332]